MKNILEMLEKSAYSYPEKYVFRDAEKSITYSDFLKKAKKIGCALAAADVYKSPVAIIISRSVECLTAMFGVLMGGCFYTVIDSEMPSERVKTIFDTLQPSAVLASEDCLRLVENLDYNGRIIMYNEASSFEPNDETLQNIRNDMVDTDPAYVLFTSGSTGIPKGAVLNHRSVLSYIEWYAKTFEINENTVFGSQTPFYFSMSVSDVFSTIYKGATLNIIPKTLFSFPIKLIEYLNERMINTVYWVPSALSIVAKLKVLDYLKPEFLKKVLFAGEVMSVKTLNYWQNKLPDAFFANLFGPTETTDICCYYIVDRKFSDCETIPIGNACDNCKLFILDENGAEAKTGEKGELYVGGSFLSMGYYNNQEKTAQSFVQNPLNRAYPEIVYKTGDIVKQNEKGELLYISRKDMQIKRMGYRIELGEIEAAASSADGVFSAAAVYDKNDDSIILVYEGKQKNTDEVMNVLKNRLPDYMIPQRVIRIKSMPINTNGKIDRNRLISEYKNF